MAYLGPYPLHDMALVLVLYWLSSIGTGILLVKQQVRWDHAQHAVTGDREDRSARSLAVQHITASSRVGTQET